MTRLVIHAGFHKTGTTTVQTTIRRNRRILRRQLRCYLKPDFETLADHSRSYSLQPSSALLARVERRAAGFFETLASDDPRPILMCCEDLCGSLPGRRDLDRYAAAPDLLGALARAARERFGDALDLHVFLSTRGREAWLRSSYWQNLRATRLTLDFESYAERMAGATDWAAILGEIGRSLAPASVSSMPLEESATLPQGPITPLLHLVALAPVTHGKLRLPEPANAQPDLQLEPALLALNRSGLDDERLAEAKRHLRQVAARQGARA